MSFVSLASNGSVIGRERRGALRAGSPGGGFRWEKGRPTPESNTASGESLHRSVSGKQSHARDANRPGGASSVLATSGRKQGDPELSPCVVFPSKLFFALTVVPSRSQLIINTAIVYMHRFYMIHSFTKFHRNVSIAALKHSDAMFTSGDG